MDLRPRRKRSPSGSSQRSNSVSSVSSSKSAGSNGSKRGRPASRKTQQAEDDVVQIVHDQLVEMVHKMHVNCISTNKEMQQQKREERNADPLYQASRKYAQSLLTQTTSLKKKEELKEGIRQRVMEKMELAERNVTGRRAAFLGQLEKNAQEREHHWEDTNIHSPVLDLRPLEEVMKGEIWQNICDNFPLIALAYQNKSVEFVETVAECSRVMKTGEACDCNHNANYRKLSPLAVAAGRGYTEFCDRVTEAAKENEHLKNLIKQWSKDLGVIAYAIENGHILTAEALANAGDLGALKVQCDFRMNYSLKAPLMLANMKESRLLKNMLQFGMISWDEFPQLVLEAVNTDDVTYVEDLLKFIRTLTARPLHDILKVTMTTGKDSERTDNAFHRAIVRGNLYMVELLAKYAGRDQLTEIDCNGLTPMYFALASGHMEIYSFLYGRYEMAFDHAQQVLDIGLETNQEQLSLQVVDKAVAKVFAKGPECVYDWLLRAICCKSYAVVEEIVKCICKSVLENEAENQDDYKRKMLWVLSAALICSHQLFTERDEQVRTNLCAMLILAGARPDGSQDQSDPQREGFYQNKELQRIFTRLNQREVVEGNPMDMEFCGRDEAMGRLLERLA